MHRQLLSRDFRFQSLTHSTNSFFQNGSRLVKLIFSFTFVRFARTAYSGTFKMTQIFLLISIRV